MNSYNKKINGWINLNKPEGISSSKCIITLKKILNVRKIGHAGTLDPLASGVLPIAIGEATKSIRFVSDEHKTYTFNICWGVETSTDDKQGKIVRKCKHVRQKVRMSGSHMTPGAKKDCKIVTSDRSEIG